MEIWLFKINRGADCLSIFFILAIFISSCTYKKLDINPCDNVSSNYTKSISPLIKTHCALSGCHNGDSISVGDFNEYTEIKMRVDNGQFKIKVFDSKLMPPASQPSLASEDYNKLKCWFDAGAPNN